MTTATTAGITWNCTRAEYDLIRRIISRVEVVGPVLAKERLLDLAMDIEACHCNGCPLRLADLADAAPADLLHDVYGIRGHLDRRTGQLEDCFVPRYACPATR